MMAIIAFYEFSSVIISSEITRMHHLITMNVFRTHPSGTLRYFIDLELDLLMVSQKKKSRDHQGIYPQRKRNDINRNREGKKMWYSMRDSLRYFSLDQS